MRQTPRQTTEYRPAKGPSRGIPGASADTSGAFVSPHRPGTPSPSVVPRGSTPYNYGMPQKSHASGVQGYAEHPGRAGTTDVSGAAGATRSNGPNIPRAPKQSTPKGPSNRTLVIILVAILAALMLALTIVFGALGKKGEETSQPEEHREGTYILYNGKEYKYDENKTNLLFLGVDKDLPMAEERAPGDMGLADAILMVSLDPAAKTMHIIAIPRETMTPVTVLDSEGDIAKKEETVLTFQYAYGKTPEQSGELMMQAVSELMFGTPIEKYCAVNFDAVPILNEEVGGVKVEVLENLTNLHPAFIQGNTVHLDGQMAFDYVHYRDTSQTGTSIIRMDRQKQYIIAYLQKLKSFADRSVEALYDLYERLGENMSTNIITEDMVALTGDFSEISMEDIRMLRIPGELKAGDEFDVYYDVYIADGAALKQMVIDIFYEEVKEGEEKNE